MMTPPPFNTSPFLQELFRPLCLLSSPLTGDLFQLQLWTLQELRTWGVTLTYSEFSEDGYITPLISSTQLTGFSLWCHALQINSPWIPLQLVLENLFQPSNNKQRKKNCYFLVVNYQCVCVCVHTYSPAGSSVHEIFQARTLECVAISSSRKSSWLSGQTHVSYISCVGRQVLYHLIVSVNFSQVCNVIRMGFMNQFIF